MNNNRTRRRAFFPCHTSLFEHRAQSSVGDAARARALVRCERDAGDFAFLEFRIRIAW